MHRCCAVWGSSWRFPNTKNVTLSHLLNLWTSSTYPDTTTNIHHRQITTGDAGDRMKFPKSWAINLLIRRNSANVSAYSKLFVTNRASRTASPNSFSLARQSRFIHLPIPFKKKQDLSALDKIPSGFECVYSSVLNIYIAYFYPVITFLSLGTIIPFVAAISLNNSLLWQNVNQSAYFDNTLQVLSTIPFALVLVYLAKYFANHCPLRIYANEDDEFIAVFATVLPWRTSRSLWNPCDLQNLYSHDDDKPSIWKALRGSHIVGKKRVIIMPYAFSYPHYYNVLLGNTLEYMQLKQEKSME